MPETELKEIKWGELQGLMRGYAQEAVAEFQEQAKPVDVKQETVKVDALIDGKPVAADLVKAETKASMGAMGIAGLVESGDHFKIMRFELGPITSALVGIPLGAVASKAISNWIPPYRDAAGVATKVRPATIGFGQVNILNPVAHVGGMVLVETWGAGLIGRTAAHFIAGTLLVSTLLAYTPLGTWLDSLVTAISPKTTTTAQNRGGLSAAQQQAIRQRHMQEQSGHNGRGVLSPF